MTQDSTDFPDNMTASVIVWPEDSKDMVFVEAGTFGMGSSDGNPNYQPKHKVHVASSYIDAWPVTNAEYKHFVEATGTSSS